jgi:hypothetical protein
MIGSFTPATLQYNSFVDNLPIASNSHGDCKNSKEIETGQLAL